MAHELFLFFQSGAKGPATPSVFAASKRDTMLLHLPYSIVVTTPDAPCRERERDAVLFWEMLKKKKKNTNADAFLVWPVSKASTAPPSAANADFMQKGGAQSLRPTWPPIVLIQDGRDPGLRPTQPPYRKGQKSNMAGGPSRP